MMHTLADPVKGATHFRRDEVAINQQHGFLLVRGTFGNAIPDGSDLDPAQPQWPETIALQDEGYTEFLDQNGASVQPAFDALMAYLDAEGLWG